MQHLRATSGAYRDIRQQNSFILSGMTASHALFHGFRQSLLVLLPNVRDTMGLSDIQATSISAVAISPEEIDNFIGVQVLK